MAQEHLNALVTAAGIEQADFDAILALPAESPDFKAEDYVGKIQTNIETRVKNDPKFWESLDENNVNEAFKKKVEAQQYGRASNVTRTKVIKALGMTDADMADLTEDEKKSLEVYVTKAVEKFSNTKVTDKQLQQQLVETRKKLEDLEIDIPVREGKIKQDYETQFNAEKLDFIILAELATVENLKAPAQYLVAKLATELKDEYAFAVSGLKAAPKQKSNSSLDVVEGTKVLTLKDLIIKKLTADGLVGDGKVEVKPQAGKVDITPDGKGGLEISSHIADKIKANTPAA